MKRQYTAGLATALVFFLSRGAPAVFAADLPRHTWKVGPETFHFKYTEKGIRDKGWFYGATGSYTYHNKLMLQAEGRYSHGRVDYSSNADGKLRNLDDDLWEVRALAGYDFRVSATSFLTPYTGIAKRYLRDDSSGKATATGARGYERMSRYTYSPFGIRYIAMLDKGWTVVGTAEYDKLWWGKETTRLSDADPLLGDAKNRQKRGYGLMASLELKKKVNGITYGVEPFARYWHVNESKHAPLIYSGVDIGEVWEPENRSTEVGVNLVAEF